VAYATNRPLYSFEPGDADTPVPDLAEFEPRISPDNRAITVKLRAGVRISPPVNREVTAADVKYAFERAFTQAVPSGYAIDEAMNRASTIPAGPERNRAWAEINRRIVSQAPANPYSWDDSFQLASKDVQGVMNGYTATWDLVFSSLR